VFGCALDQRVGQHASAACDKAGAESQFEFGYEDVGELRRLTAHLAQPYADQNRPDPTKVDAMIDAFAAGAAADDQLAMREMLAELFKFPRLSDELYVTHDQFLLLLAQATSQFLSNRDPTKKLLLIGRRGDHTQDQRGRWDVSSEEWVLAHIAAIFNDGVSIKDASVPFDPDIDSGLNRFARVFYLRNQDLTPQQIIEFFNAKNAPAVDEVEYALFDDVGVSGDYTSKVAEDFFVALATALKDGTVSPPEGFSLLGDIGPKVWRRSSADTLGLGGLLSIHILLPVATTNVLGALSSTLAARDILRRLYYLGLQIPSYRMRTYYGRRMPNVRTLLGAKFDDWRSLLERYFAPHIAEFMLFGMQHKLPAGSLLPLPVFLRRINITYRALPENTAWSRIVKVDDDGELFAAPYRLVAPQTQN